MLEYLIRRDYVKLRIDEPDEYLDKTLVEYDRATKQVRVFYKGTYCTLVEYEKQEPHNRIGQDSLIIVREDSIISLSECPHGYLSRRNPFRLAYGQFPLANELIVKDDLIEVYGGFMLTTNGYLYFRDPIEYSLTLIAVCVDDFTPLSSFERFDRYALTVIQNSGNCRYYTEDNPHGRLLLDAKLHGSISRVICCKFEHYIITTVNDMVHIYRGWEFNHGCIHLPGLKDITGIDYHISLVNFYDGRQKVLRWVNNQLVLE